MAKFCGSCGAQLDDSAKICGICGTPLAGVSAKTKIPGINEISISPKQKEMVKKYAPLAGIAIVALIVVIIIISTIAGSVGYKGAVKKYFKAYQKLDAEILYDLHSSYDEEVADFHDRDYDEKDEIDNLDDYLDMFDESMKDEVGRDYKVKYKIVDKYKLDDRDFERLSEDLAKSNGAEEYNEKKDEYEPAIDLEDIASKVMCVEIEVTVKGKKDTEEYDLELYLAKEKGGWKVIDEEWD